MGSFDQELNTMITVKLTLEEIEILHLTDPSTKADGGFQSLLTSLQDLQNEDTGEIVLTEELVERIHRYAFQYHDGGWQKRLVDIFGRTLGPNLDAGLVTK